jgi:hypothetical protein
VMTAGSQHQLGAAFGADGRQGWTIDINHQGVSALPRAAPDGAASGLVILGRPVCMGCSRCASCCVAPKICFQAPNQE